MDNFDPNQPWLMYQNKSQNAAPEAPSGGFDPNQPWLMYQDSSAPETPKKNYKLSKVPGAALKNLPSSAANFGSGLLDMASHPIQSIGSALDVGAGAIRNALPKGFMNAVEEKLGGKEGGERASKAAFDFADAYKKRYGSYEDIKRAIAEDPVGVASDLAALFSGVGGMTGLKAVSKAGEAINPMRALTAPASLAGKAAGKGAAKVYNYLDPKSEAYLNAAEGRAPEIINKLRGDNVIVPGSMPTASQAASPIGATKFSALGQFAADKLPTPHFQRMEEQKAAQLKHVQEVGKTKPELEKAKSERSTEAKSLYGASEKKSIPLGEESVVSGKPKISYNASIKELMDTPAIKSAFREASIIAANKGTTLYKKDGSKVSLTGEGAHLVKLALDDAISPSPATPLAKNTANSINQARNKYVSWVEKNIPEYKEAREKFAEKSKPINQMEVGQYVENKLRPTLGEDTARLRYPGYSTALKEAAATLKKSTGDSRYKELADVLTDSQVKKLNAVRDDLRRMVLTEKQGNAASPAASSTINIRKGSASPTHAVPNLVGAAQMVMDRIGGKLSEKQALEIAAEMLQPKEAAKYLEKAVAHEARSKRIANSLAGRPNKTLNALAVTNRSSSREE